MKGSQRGTDAKAILRPIHRRRRTLPRPRAVAPKRSCTASRRSLMTPSGSGSSQNPSSGTE